jgi:hypothetical protein
MLGGLLGAAAPLARAASGSGEVMGGGSSTAGLVKLASGLWQRGPAAGVSIGDLPVSHAAADLANNPLINYDQWGGAAGGVASGSGGSAGAASNAGMFGGIKSSLTSLGNLGSKFSSAHGGVNGAAGGAMLAGGGILAADGLRRGGWAGVGETTAGGALIGAKFGGPLGAAIGGIIGFGAGMVRKVIKSSAEKVMEKVRTIYGLSIDKNTAQQIVEIANQRYAKNLDMAVRAADVRDLLMLYAEATGQPVAAALMSNRPRAASLAESGGRLYQETQWMNGQPYGTPTSSLPTFGGYSNGGGSPQGPTTVQLVLNGGSAADLLDGRIATTVSPAFVQSQWANAAQSSNGRLQNAATLLRPGMTVA